MLRLFHPIFEDQELGLQWSEHIVSAPHFEAGEASLKMIGRDDMLRPL